MRVNNDHSYEQLAAPIFDMRIPDQLALVVRQRNAFWIKVCGKIVFLPLFIPAPDFRNVAAHYQAVQFEEGGSVGLLGFAVKVSHDGSSYRPSAKIINDARLVAFEISVQAGLSDSKKTSASTTVPVFCYNESVNIFKGSDVSPLRYRVLIGG